jgi:EAL domain-containing protein (putative c-di-GMP-specific phosphodiesterase class I)
MSKCRATLPLRAATGDPSLGNRRAESAVVLAFPPQARAASGPRVNDLLREAREALGMPIAFVSRFLDGRRVIEAVDATCPVPFGPGDSHAAEDTYCQRIIDGALPQAIPDSAANPVTAALPVTAELEIGSYVGVPIVLLDGSVYGTLCAYSDQARPVDERDTAILSLVARSVAYHLSSEVAEHAERAATRARVTDVIDKELLRSVYQPIVDASTGSAVCVEALTRFDGPVRLRPDEWFADAARVGEAAALEIAAIRCAVDGLASLPDSVALSVNVSAAVLLDPLFADWLAVVPVGRLILELTEHEAVSDYARLNAVLSPARERGLRLAVDDAGAGYASMRHTLLLQPDVLKLDISLVRDLDTDSGKRALCGAIITFARSSGTRVVAEGVETAAELAAVRRLGVDYVQGYHLAAPAPLAEVRFDGYGQDRRHGQRESEVAPETLLMIHELSHAGASPATIAARLNQAGEPTTRGVRWHKSAVIQILSDTPKQ